MSEISNWLEASYPKEQYTPGFERILSAYSLFNLNLKDIKVVTVAGTNGKGTVSSSVFENIRLNNKRVSLFKSPHLFSILERFKFSDINLTEEELLVVFKDTHKELSSRNINLSFYEFTLIVFLRLSLEHKSSFIVLEVGLGGRLDATNIVDADVALITSISRDHMDLLGKRYDKILAEKFGILKKKSTCYASFELDYLVKKSKLYCQNNGFVGFIRKDDNKLIARNRYLIKSTVEFFGLEFFKAKFETVSTFGNHTFSCAHNLGAVRNLVSSLIKNPHSISKSLILLSYSHRDIKELEYMSKLFLELRPFVEDIYLTQINQFKAASVEDLKYISKKLGISFVDRENLNNVIKENKKIYLSGSNYFVGSFINQFK